MAVIGTEAGWGMVCTCTGGTSAAAVIVAKGNYVPVSAIICGGAATTDVVVVADANGKILWKGAGLVNQTDNITFGNNPPRLDGLVVSIAGATTGWVNIVYASR